VTTLSPVIAITQYIVLVDPIDGVVRLRKMIDATIEHELHEIGGLHVQAIAMRVSSESVDKPVLDLAGTARSDRHQAPGLDHRRGFFRSFRCSSGPFHFVRDIFHVFVHG
jgi:hypothetical protein